MNTCADRNVPRFGIEPSCVKPKPVFESGGVAVPGGPNVGPNFSYRLRVCGTFRSLCGLPSALPLNRPALATSGSPGLMPPSLPLAAPNGSAWQAEHD
ncbi:MAG: hypothetical protein DMF51_14875 [Acidobacteria bacterium]|nr:MAG: hypothetical protein DMF51_14875 [Acidobacteriota bacterium]